MKKILFTLFIILCAFATQNVSAQGKEDSIKIGVITAATIKEVTLRPGTLANAPVVQADLKKNAIRNFADFAATLGTQLHRNIDPSTPIFVLFAGQSAQRLTKENFAKLFNTLDVTSNANIVVVTGQAS